ncbi:hypothetical protein ACYATL_00140 [Actinotignum timonense]|uniref:hypothetical protein n=1 Tax=Actinotignum TaxID=1653174 RepID=UPI002551ADE6|nr:hypothetical protein [Actinotignum timonense]MDK6906090.1 hypothetical protein [Actinotignum timonense]MDY5138152.1 hypothetical protein [Actinotignum timonense]
MSRKKIAAIIAGVMAVVLLGAGLWAVVVHNNRAKALEEATAAYTKAGTALEKVVSTVDTTGCTENGGTDETCKALEKAVADAKAGLAEKPGKDVAKVKEAAAKREKLAESLAALSKTLTTQQANAVTSYLGKECPATLDPECDTLRGAGLKLTEAKSKTEAIKARAAAASAPAPEAPAAPAPANDSGAGGEVSGDTGYSGGEADYGYSYSEPAYEAPGPEPVYEAPAAPEPEVESNSGGGRWVESWEPNGTDDCWQGDTKGNAWRCP